MYTDREKHSLISVIKERKSGFGSMRIWKELFVFRGRSGPERAAVSVGPDTDHLHRFQGGSGQSEPSLSQRHIFLCRQFHELPTKNIISRQSTGPWRAGHTGTKRTRTHRLSPLWRFITSTVTNRVERIWLTYTSPGIVHMEIPCFSIGSYTARSLH